MRWRGASSLWRSTGWGVRRRPQRSKVGWRRSQQIVTLPLVWIDGDGVSHSIALPHPTDLMTDEFRTSLDVLRAQARPAVMQVVDDELDRFFDQDLTALSEPEGVSAFEGQAPPMHLLDGQLRAPEDVRAAIANIDLRWRIDVIEALADYVQGEVIISLTPDEALVLVDLLRRWQDADSVTAPVHRAEHVALRFLSALLERGLPEPFDPRRGDLIAEARGRLASSD